MQGLLENFHLIGEFELVQEHQDSNLLKELL